MENLTKLVNTLLLAIILIVVLITKCDKVDVIHSETKDTVWRDSVIVIMNQPVHVNPTIPPSTINNYGSNVDLNALVDSLKQYMIPFCDTFNRDYKIPYEDSLIQMEINPSIKGNLISIPFNYKIKPQTISYPEITITKRLPPRGFYIGLSVQRTTDVYRTFDLFPEASFVYDKNIFGVGFSPLTQSYQFRYSRRIF